VRRVIAAALAGSFAVLAPPAPPAAGNPDIPAAQEAVVGLSVRGSHRAYPTTLFSSRRVVNDVIGGMEIAVFHDPERGLSTAWFRMVLGEPIEFSGAADGAVADDLTTVTRWDLTNGAAIGGSLRGQRLVPLAVTTTSWAAWTARHPDAEIFTEGR
jgi:hypothetical protein